MQESDVLPHSIRSLKAVEAIVGNRKLLAEKLKVNSDIIDSWIYRKSIPKNFLVGLADLSEGRFCERDFIVE